MFNAKEQEFMDNELYTPKSDQEVLEDIQNGSLPKELQEQQSLVEQVPEKIIQKIQEIINRILQANKLDADEYRINIQISHKDHENAGIITHAKIPLLFITTELLRGVVSEDELAAVLAHEIGHLILYYADKKANHHNKIEESLADALGVKLLSTAGYDPNAVKYFLTRAGDEDTHLITLDNLKNEESMGKAINLVSRLTDPHPIQPMRVRAVETLLTSLERNAEIPPFKGQITRLSAEFYALVDKLSYKSPVQLVMEGLAYETKTTSEKLRSLAVITEKCISLYNETYHSRLKEIAVYVKTLKINFSDAAETEAFKCLADSVMFLKNLGRIATHYFVLGEDLQNLWVRGGNNPNYFARREDFKNAMELFTHATNERQAEQIAAEIVTIANKIYLGGFVYKMNPIESLQVPDEITIRQDLASSSKWVPPYAKHLQWYQDSKSENIKKVLLAMELDNDPWVLEQLGGNSTPTFEWKKWYQINGRWQENNPNINYTFFKSCIRNAKGEITGIVPQIANYAWKHIDRNASKDEIIAHQTLEAVKKRLYDEEVTKDIDWTLLRTNFPLFMYQYGLLLEHNPLLKREQFPFAQQFYARLDKELATADEAFRLQVQDFLKNILDPKLPFTIYRHNDIYPLKEYWKNKDKWPYVNVERPRYHDMNDPFIQFILKYKALLDDEEIFDILMWTSGFKKTDWNTKLVDIYKIPLSTVFNEYPKQYQDISSFKQAFDTYIELKESKRQQELDEWIKSNFKQSGRFCRVPDVVYLIEVERLAYAHQDTMSVADYVSLDEVTECFRSALDICNFSAFMSQLRVKVIKASLRSNDLACLIRDYRIISAYNLFYEPATLRAEYFSKIQSLISPLDPELKLHYLCDLFKPQLIKESSFLHFHKQYDGYLIANFRNWAVEEYTRALAKKMGQDDSSQVFFESSKKIVDELIVNTTGITQLEIISSLAEKINAQKELAYYMRDKCKQDSLKNALSSTGTGILVEYFLHESSSDAVLRDLIITFLSNPLNEQRTNRLVQYIASKNPQLKGILGFDVHNRNPYLYTSLCNYHRDFHASILEMKTIFLEPMLFPLNSSENGQKKTIKKLINQVFPQSDKDQNDIAHLIVTAYLNAAKIEERRLLATAMFVANMQEEGAKILTTGQKLYEILSNIGPAGAKLLQAIHSHPQTPEDIKNDLAKSKTEFSKPKRWEYIELVEKAGLLQKSDTNLNPIKMVGPIIGAGSFGVTSFNTLEDGSSFADTFLRTNAASQASREFKMMQVAAQEIVAEKSSMQPIVNMIEEANRLAGEETDFSKAEAANSLAENAYEHYKLIQIGSYQFTNQVAKFKARGSQFKRVDIAYGVHFNDLPKSPYKEAVAKAVLLTQLSLRLSGINTDLDRHGGNIKVEGNVISHFDFGAMNTKPISQEDKTTTGKVLAQAINFACVNHEDFNEALLKAIQIAQVTPETRVYLNGLTKDLLALGDYMNCISSDNLVSIMAFCLSAKSVEPNIMTAFKEELGGLSAVINLSIQQKSINTDFKIIEDTSNKSQTQTPAQLVNPIANAPASFFATKENSNNQNTQALLQMSTQTMCIRG